ncbi:MULTISPECIES: DUF2529 family protein [Bacillus]|uniref:DUF2529 family protein n=1 Tax=Bacillus TaxID=1386 RepID=UPI00031CB985|nr:MULTISPECIES: DUF2529 family protein [Bacillus]
MLKIFSTQLSGIFKTISEDEFSIEDAARLLAQAIIGDGSIYIHGFDEMKGIYSQASEGIEQIPNCKPLLNNGEIAPITDVDRALIISRFSHDVRAIELAGELQKSNVSFVALSTIQDEQLPGLHQLADVHIHLPLKRGLVPTETGERAGFPTLLIALYAFHGISLTLQELLDELQ